MDLESRLLRSIRQRSSNVVLRSEIASFGSKSQTSVALNNLIKRGVLVKIGRGVFSKAKISSISGRFIPVAGLEVLVPEVMKKLGVSASLGKLALDNAAGKTTQLPGKFVVNTGARRISRKITVGGRTLAYENDFKRAV